MPSNFEPQRSDKFTFGLWTMGNPGGDPFGEPVRQGFTPVEMVEALADTGAWGVNLHDNDLVPFGASAQEQDRIVQEFQQALRRTGLVVPMATTNLFKHPVFKDGALTSNDAEVRAFAYQKVMRSMELGAQLGAKTYVFWGGREGAEVDAGKDAKLALARLRDAIDFFCEYSKEQGYGYRFALEAKPNEPRGDIYLPTTGAMLGFIATLADPSMVGVNPEVAHETIAGLNFYHAIAQAIDAGKLFHIDLNGQKPGRFDQDLRFAQEDVKGMFFLVRLLENTGYDGSKHFDAHALRTSDRDDVIAFAKGCMRSYVVLREKAKQFDADPIVQEILATVNRGSAEFEPAMTGYSSAKAQTLLSHSFDAAALAARPIPYERLDQRLFDILLGAV